jgi:hypothetical protein
VQLHCVYDIDAGKGMERDAQVFGHCFCRGIIVKLEEEHPLGLSLMVIGELLGAVVAFAVRALSHQLVGREAAKTRACSSGGGCGGGRR